MPLSWPGSGRAATLRTVNKAKAGGPDRGQAAGPGRRTARRRPQHQKVVRALLTGYLLHTLTGDKAYARLRRPRDRPAEGAAVDPFADDPVDMENKVVALLKP